jgi:hypothetical protein
VIDLNLVKEILTNKLYYKKPTTIMTKLAFFGEGLLTMNGKKLGQASSNYGACFSP